MSSGRRMADWVYIGDVIEGFLAAAMAPEIGAKARSISVQEALFQFARLLPSWSKSSAVRSSLCSAFFLIGRPSTSLRQKQLLLPGC